MKKVGHRLTQELGDRSHRNWGMGVKKVGHTLSEGWGEEGWITQELGDQGEEGGSHKNWGMRCGGGR